MTEQLFKYIIIGANQAGGRAVEGIREVDAEGSIGVFGREAHLPYNRPPLTKELWTGKKQINNIFFHDDAYYTANNATLIPDTSIVKVDPGEKYVEDHRGRKYHYEKLLLATGGYPRRLDIPGGEMPGMTYYRYLNDYLRIRRDASEGKSAVVIGGGFIGSEIAAALNMSKVNVTMLFPEPYLVQRVFPEGLGRALTELYGQRGIRILAKDVPEGIERWEKGVRVRTKGGEELQADIIIAGIGIQPLDGLAKGAGLETNNGIVVNELLQTSNPDIYAAGDNANFPYQALEQHMRIEHWDNALSQGKWAGRNMAGANEPFTYMPYFYSDLFEFGYEAVGEVTSKLVAFADWQKENDTGVIYYLKDNVVRGVMNCNIFGKLDDARELIRNKTKVENLEELRGRIKLG